MDRQELENLNRLADSLVQGRPIAAAVLYDEDSSRLTVSCRSGNRLHREWSPVVSDYADLDSFVRDRVTEFVKDWAGEE